MVSPALEGVLGVVGGARTIRSGLYRRALATPRRRVIQRIAQPLSAHIEAGRVGTPAFERDLARILGPLVRADAILLACTHYPSAREAFRRLAPRTSLLDPAEAVVETLIARWRLPRGRGDLFLTTGAPGEMRRAARTAWGERSRSVRVGSDQLGRAQAKRPVRDDHQAVRTWANDRRIFAERSTAPRVEVVRSRGRRRRKRSFCRPRRSRSGAARLVLDVR